MVTVLLEGVEVQPATVGELVAMGVQRQGEGGGGAASSDVAQLHPRARFWRPEPATLSWAALRGQQLFGTKKPLACRLVSVDAVEHGEEAGAGGSEFDLQRRAAARASRHAAVVHAVRRKRAASDLAAAVARDVTLRQRALAEARYGGASSSGADSGDDAAPEGEDLVSNTALVRKVIRARGPRAAETAATVMGREAMRRLLTAAKGRHGPPEAAPTPAPTAELPLMPIEPVVRPRGAARLAADPREEVEQRSRAAASAAACVAAAAAEEEVQAARAAQKARLPQFEQRARRDRAL